MKFLAAVSTGQLILGLRTATRRGTTFDVGPMRGSPDTMRRDQWATGTNLSAPGIMLVVQAMATVCLFTRWRSEAARTLGVMGTLQSLGYPAERSVRAAWRHPEPGTTTLTAAAELLALTMAVIGLRSYDRIIELYPATVADHDVRSWRLNLCGQSSPTPVAKRALAVEGVAAVGVAVRG